MIDFNNIKNNQENQTLSFAELEEKIKKILYEKLNLNLDSVEIGTSDFVRPKQNSSVFYKVFNNGNGFVLFAGDFATDEQFSECLNGSGETRTMTEADRQAIQEATEERQKELAKQAEEDAKQAVSILKNSNNTIPEDFGYCQKKGLTGSDFKAFQFVGYNPKYKNIVMPLFDINGKHWANQFIYPDKITLKNGEKTDKLTKGKMSHCFNVAGDIENSDIVYFAEGAATALIVHLATGKPCVFCVNAGNIEPVFLAFKGKFQDKKLILIADNDLKKEAEEGINKGRETAEKLNSKYSLPYILSPVNSDFNDYYKGFIDAGHTRKQALSKVKEYILNPNKAARKTASEVLQETIKIFPKIQCPTNILNEELEKILKDHALSQGIQVDHVLSRFIAFTLGFTGFSIKFKIHDSRVKIPKFWGVCVNGSGRNKTAPFKQLMRPAEDIASLITSERAEAEKIYKKALKDYNRSTTTGTPEPEEPAILKEGLPVITAATMEAAAVYYSKRNNSLLILRDELSGFVSGIGQYKKNGDAELFFWLDSYEGNKNFNATKTDGIRESEFISYIIGNCTFGAYIKHFFSDTAIDRGLTGRFEPTTDELGKRPPKSKKPWGYQKQWIEYGEKLKAYYNSLTPEKLKNSFIFTLNQDAKSYFDKIEDSLEILRVEELEKYPELDAVSSKISKSIELAVSIATALKFSDIIMASNLEEIKTGKVDFNADLTLNDIQRGFRAAFFYVGNFLALFAKIRFNLTVKNADSSDIEKMKKTLSRLKTHAATHTDGKKYLRLGYIRKAFDEDHGTNTTEDYRARFVENLFEKAGLETTTTPKNIKNKNDPEPVKQICLKVNSDFESFVTEKDKNGVFGVHGVQSLINQAFQNGRQFSDGVHGVQTASTEDEKEEATDATDARTPNGVHAENPINKDDGRHGRHGRQFSEKNNLETEVLENDEVKI
ncbi:MAG: DUF3987 domain-containing protein [Desulforegulaceae bacterium]|nr:DUF3987 domain-containing protein [Desulforegulaceae bacterium]